MLQPSDKLTTRSYLFFVKTQFLGAFNDNVFKQMMLLLAVGAAASDANASGSDKQGLVMIVFTLPFLLFSGYAGQLSEMHPKSTIMRLSKIGELFIMLGGFLGFYLQSLPFLLVVLFFMGSQSAFFGPAKYGVIPEIVSDKSLVAANGIVQMTTIVAITMGIALGGVLKKNFSDQLHLASLFCVGISILGIAAVYMIVASKANKPGMRLDWNPIGRLKLSFADILKDKPLFMALIAYTYFYFSGALVTTTVNRYGLTLLKLDDQATSMLLVFLSAGIMAGSLAAAPVQRRLSGKWTIFTGALGVAVSEFLLFFHHLPLAAIKTFLFTAGMFSGLYFVPIAAFMQSRPPLGRKGEILAAVNFSNFAGILFSAVIWIFMINYMEMPVQNVWMVLSIGLAILLVVMFPQLKKIE